MTRNHMVGGEHKTLVKVKYQYQGINRIAQAVSARIWLVLCLAIWLSPLCPGTILGAYSSDASGETPKYRVNGSPW